MARQKYELNGTIYNVNLGSEEGQAWLNGDGKNAKLLDPEQGKNQSSAQDATAEQNPTASDSQSGTTSSDSQKEDKGLITTFSGLGRSFARIYQGLGSITEAIEATTTELLMNYKYGIDLTPEQRKKLRYTVKAKSYVSM